MQLADKDRNIETLWAEYAKTLADPRAHPAQHAAMLNAMKHAFHAGCIALMIVEDVEAAVAVAQDIMVGKPADKGLLQ